MSTTHLFPHVQITCGLNGIPAVDDLDFFPVPQRISGVEAERTALNTLRGSWWPASSAFEASLVEQLEGICPHGTAPDRLHITTLLTALRNRSTIDDVLSCLPGVDICQLRGSYELLEREMSRSIAAWKRVTEGNRNRRTLSQSLRLMPVATRSVIGGTPESIEATLAHCATVRASVDRVFDALDHYPARSLEGVCLGRMLFRGFGAGLFCDPNFVPSRVGELSPERVEALLT